MDLNKIRSINNNINQSISGDRSIGYRTRKYICECKEYYIRYSFDHLKFNFTTKDIEYFNNLNNVLSIHSADNIAVFLYVDPNLSNRLGFNRDFIIGKSLYSFLHSHDIDYLSHLHDLVLQGNDEYSNIRLRTYTNNYINIESSIKKIDNIIISYQEPINDNTSLGSHSSYKDNDIESEDNISIYHDYDL
jgi:hypothetical protein